MASILYDIVHESLEARSDIADGKIVLDEIFKEMVSSKHLYQTIQDFAVKNPQLFDGLDDELSSLTYNISQYQELFTDISTMLLEMVESSGNLTGNTEYVRQTTSMLQKINNAMRWVGESAVNLNYKVNVVSAHLLNYNEQHKIKQSFSELLYDFKRILPIITEWLSYSAKVDHQIAMLLVKIEEADLFVLDTKIEELDLFGYGVKVLEHSNSTKTQKQNIEGVYGIIRETFHRFSTIIDKHFPSIKRRIKSLPYIVDLVEGRASSDYRTLGTYSNGDQSITLYYLENHTVTDLLLTLTHEVSHYIYNNVVSESFKKDFEVVFYATQNKKALYITPETFDRWFPTDEITHRYDRYCAKEALMLVLKNNDPDLLLTMETGFSNIENVNKRNALSPYSATIWAYKKYKQTLVIPLPSYKGTLYASTNPDEFFCEALSHMLVVGPRSFDFDVRTLVEKGLNIRLGSAKRSLRTKRVV